MNNKKIIQYLVLILIGVSMNYHFMPIGDYCRGLLNVLNLIFFGGIFLILFLIICSINFYKKIKYNKKFDLIPILIFITFSLTLYGLIKLDYNKFWTKKTLVGRISYEDKPTNGVLKLYTNKTFDATVNYADFSCTYAGEYEILNDKVKLKRMNLEHETEKLFTTEYLILAKEKKMKPFDNKFSVIEIIENIE